jgi:hypothetical protein
MRRRLWRLGVLVLVGWLLPIEPVAHGDGLEPAPGNILAPTGRQVSWLNRG